MKYLACAIVVLTMGCISLEKGSLTAPSSETSQPKTTEPGGNVPAPLGISVTGPTGCLKSVDLPKVLTWTIQNVPAGAKVDRSYEGDEESTCDPTPDTNIRTQNDHLRYVLHGSTLFVEFDRDTFACGRAQVDISINQELAFALVIRYPEPCKEPPKPIEPPKTEPPKEEPPKQEPPKEQPPKTEPPREEPPKQEPPKTEAPKGNPCSPGYWKNHESEFNKHCGAASALSAALNSCEKLMTALTCHGSDASCRRSEAAGLLNQVSQCTEK